MAAILAAQSPFPFIVFSHKKRLSIFKFSISTLLNSAPLFSFSITSAPISFSLSKPLHPSLLTNCSTISPDPQPGNGTLQSPSTIVFVKGLPLSTTERCLKRTFSEFGEVSRVKLVSNRKTQQSLAFAYIWFTSEDSAQVAIKEMNGKFFNGRFISVTIAKFGSCQVPRRATPYKF